MITGVPIFREFTQMATKIKTTTNDRNDKFKMYTSVNMYIFLVIKNINGVKKEENRVKIQ